MCSGGGAWTSGTTDMYQYLGVDLGYRQVITGVATQGRRGSREFVSEYYLWFSSDNNTWNVYTNEYGTPLVCHLHSFISFALLSSFSSLLDLSLSYFFTEFLVKIYFIYSSSYVIGSSTVKVCTAIQPLA